MAPISDPKAASLPTQWPILRPRMRGQRPESQGPRRVNRERAFSGETEKSGGRVPQRTHRANHNDSPRPKGENRIVWKYMAELGISCEAMAGAGRPMPSTTGEAGFGEKEFGSSGRIQACLAEMVEIPLSGPPSGEVRAVSPLVLRCSSGRSTDVGEIREEPWTPVASLPPPGSSCMRNKSRFQAHPSMRICCFSLTISFTVDILNPC